MAKNNIVYVNPDVAPWLEYKGDIKLILNSIEQSSHVMWCDAFEGLRWPNDDNIDAVYELVQLMGQRDLMVTIITSLDSDTISRHWGELGQFVKIVPWESYFLYNGVIRFTARKLVPDCPDFPYEDDHYGITYPFIVYNGKPRPHRCQLMDTLAEQGMLKRNAYTWNRTTEYGFESFDNKQTPVILQRPDPTQPPKWLDDFKVYHMGTACRHHPNLIDNTMWYSYNVHPQYAQAFCQVVPETTVDHCWITEKTVEPILAQKPFLILGAPGIHEKLTDMGFYLYDDIFDYSFDKEKDITKRIDGITDNLKRLEGQSLNLLYRKISHVTWNNVQRLLNIVKNQQLVPKDIYSYHVNEYIKEIAHSTDCIGTHEYFSALFSQNF